VQEAGDDLADGGKILLEVLGGGFFGKTLFEDLAEIVGYAHEFAVRNEEKKGRDGERDARHVYTKVGKGLYGLVEVVAESDIDIADLVLVDLECAPEGERLEEFLDGDEETGDG
jgi:hypothetical protein